MSNFMEERCISSFQQDIHQNYICILEVHISLFRMYVYEYQLLLYIAKLNAQWLRYRFPVHTVNDSSIYVHIGPSTINLHHAIIRILVTIFTICVHVYSTTVMNLSYGSQAGLCRIHGHDFCFFFDWNGHTIYCCLKCYISINFLSEKKKKTYINRHTIKSWLKWDYHVDFVAFLDFIYDQIMESVQQVNKKKTMNSHE